MKRTIAAILMIGMVLAFTTTALAADIQVTKDTEDLTAGGTVTLTFSVVNTSAYDMRDFDISGYGGISGWPDLKNAVVNPGGSLQFRLRDVPVEADMLGQTLVYTLMWTENGEAKSQNISVDIGSAAAVTPMQITRQASKTAGAKGEKITLTYTLKNPSNVSMTNIELKDSIAGNQAIKSGFSLEPGAALDILYEYTITDQDAKSVPAVTYQINGQTQTVGLEELTISAVNVGISVAASMGENTPEGVLFTLVLTNTGNQNISKIQLTDELGNKVNEDTFTLEAGKERTLSFLIQTTEPRNVYFVVTGVDALGQPFEDKTQSYEVRPYIDAQLVSLALTPWVVEPLSEQGKMKVRFQVQNNSSVEITDAVISEEEMGELTSLGTLALGETSCEMELSVGEPRELVFTLTAWDPSGVDHNYTARMTADYVNIATPTPNAEQTQKPEEEGKPAGLSGTLLTVLIVLASLMAIAGIALLVLSVYERKNNARLEEESEAPSDKNTSFQSSTTRRPTSSTRNATSEHSPVIRPTMPHQTRDVAPEPRQPVGENVQNPPKINVQSDWQQPQAYYPGPTGMPVQKPELENLSQQEYPPYQPEEPWHQAMQQPIATRQELWPQQSQAEQPLHQMETDTVEGYSNEPQAHLTGRNPVRRIRPVDQNEDK